MNQASYMCHCMYTCAAPSKCFVTIPSFCQYCCCMPCHNLTQGLGSTNADSFFSHASYTATACVQSCCPQINALQATEHRPSLDNVKVSLLSFVHAISFTRMLVLFSAQAQPHQLFPGLPCVSANSCALAAAIALAAAKSGHLTRRFYARDVLCAHVCVVLCASSGLHQFTSLSCVHAGAYALAAVHHSAGQPEHHTPQLHAQAFWTTMFVLLSAQTLFHEPAMCTCRPSLSGCSTSLCWATSTFQCPAQCTGSSVQPVLPSPQSPVEPSPRTAFSLTAQTLLFSGCCCI